MSSVKSFPAFLRVAATISAVVSDQYTLTATLPVDAQAMLVGIEVVNEADLYTHEVRSIAHNDYEAITKSTDASGSGVTYGPHLGAVANCVTPSVYNRTDKSVMWAGPIRKPEFGTTKGFAGIPIKGGREISITVKKLWSAATTMASVYFVFLPHPEAAEKQRRQSGAIQLAGFPHWLAEHFAMASGSEAVDGYETERTWNTHDDYDLAVKQYFAAVYRDASGWSLNETDRKVLGVRVHGYGNEELKPNWAESYERVPHIASPHLRDFCPERAPRIVIPAKTGLVYRGKTWGAAAGETQLLFTAYGVMAPNSN